MEKFKELLQSRKFWAAFLMLITLVVSHFVPNFVLSIEDAAGLLIIVISYIIGVAIDPGVSGWTGVIQSRKFWAALVGFVVLWLDAFGVVLPLNITPEQIIVIAITFSGYIVGVSLEKPKDPVIEDVDI